MNNFTRLVEDFVASWNRLDYIAIEAAMTDDIVYHNIPMEPCIGIAGFRSFIERMPAEKAEWTIHAIAENGPMVMTERTDRFEIKGVWISIRVMGIFKFRDLKIAEWRDYFDLNEFTSQLPESYLTAG
jgi:limonene-1,2-epoxide hydrolase